MTTTPKTPFETGTARAREQLQNPQFAGWTPTGHTPPQTTPAPRDPRAFENGRLRALDGGADASHDAVFSRAIGRAQAARLAPYMNRINR